MEPEFFSEEEEIEWHERMLKRVAAEESRRIIRSMAQGYRPDIIDRILLRLARNPQKARKQRRSMKRE